MAIASVSKDSEKPHYHGHRDRLRQRFLRDNGQSLPDYELLELLLFTAVPRRDIKPLAKRLIEKFETLAGILSAPHDLLIREGLSENTATFLKACCTAGRRLTTQNLQNRSVLGAWEDVEEYCRAHMAHEKQEQFRILFLNNKNHLIKDEIQQVGTVNHTPVYPREIIKRALELGATALILIHNHPSGDNKPSKADIQMTEMIVDATNAVDITVHDHLIVGSGTPFSFRNAGLL